MIDLDTIQLPGTVAGVMASGFWTLTSIWFTAAGHRVGSTTVNALRIGLAIILLGLLYHFYVAPNGEWIPHVSGAQLWYLGLSGLLGLAIGDQALFTAFVLLGPRRTNLLMTSAPIFGAVLGYLALNETLSGRAWLGMFITISGVMWVILERPRAKNGAAPDKPPLRGILLALFGGFCQAGGLLLSKIGMGHGLVEESARLDPLGATFVRMIFAGLGIMPIVLIWRWRLKKHRAAGREPLRTGKPAAGYGFIVLGTIVGPVLGVWMSLVAVNSTEVGIAQTLLSLTPVFILPYAAFVQREHVSWRAVIGAFIAVAGVGLLFGEA